MRGLAILLSATLLPIPAVALDCSNLTPTPPQNTDVSYKGKLDAAIEGAFARLATVKGTAEGNYTRVGTSVLQQFATGNTTYMWERVLFLQCQLLGEAKDIPANEKLHMVGQLYDNFGSPPPPIELKPASTTNVNSGNTSTYSGNTNSGGVSNIGNGSVSNSGNTYNNGNSHNNNLTNSGNNTNIVQGDGNSVSIEKRK